MNGKLLLLVYGLLANIQEKTYLKFFKMIDNYLHNYEPKSVNIDYELATINSVKKLYPTVKINGCLFHYSQNLWKNFKSLGLVVDFSSDKYIRTHFSYQRLYLLFQMSLSLKHS